MKFNRRKFINYLMSIGGLTTAGSVLYPVFSYLTPPKVRVATVKSLKAGNVDNFKINSSKILKFGRKPIILIRKEDGEFAALTATCTHLDCIVQYKKDSKIINCACHNGMYDLNGKNISGPPPRPLDQLNVQIVDNEIIITT